MKKIKGIYIANAFGAGLKIYGYSIEELKEIIDYAICNGYRKDKAKIQVMEEKIVLIYIEEKETYNDNYVITEKLMKEKIIEKYKIKKDFKIVKVIHKNLDKATLIITLILKIEIIEYVRSNSMRKIYYCFRLIEEAQEEFEIDTKRVAIYTNSLAESVIENSALVRLLRMCLEEDIPPTTKDIEGLDSYISHCIQNLIFKLNEKALLKNE